MTIGPGPTTDRFIVVTYDENDHVIPKNLPFGANQEFGTVFLSQFQCCCVNASVFKKLTIVDTTEILSGDNFTRELEWLAEQADIIFCFLILRICLFLENFADL